MTFSSIGHYGGIYYEKNDNSNIEVGSAAEKENFYMTVHHKKVTVHHSDSRNGSDGVL